MDPFLFIHIPLEVKKQELVSLQEHIFIHWPFFS